MKNNDFKFRFFNGGIDDVFHNQFDITWAKVGPGMESFNKTLTLLPIESAEDDGTVVYNYNNEFFRSDDFVAEHSEPHILFAGCSQTEGVGAPLESVWSKVLLDDINKEKGTNSGFYTIARSGFGWQKVISHYMLYIDKYGVPDQMFVLLPNLGRFFEWDDSKESFVYVQRYPNSIDDSSKWDPDNLPQMTLLEQEFTKEEHRRCFVDFSVSWKLFERYCESLGTKILWASWDYHENKNYELANLSKNYVSLSEENLIKFIQEKRPNGMIDQFDLTRRDGHSGILVNEYWATEFKKEAKARGWI